MEVTIDGGEEAGRGCYSASEIALITCKLLILARCAMTAGMFDWTRREGSKTPHACLCVDDCSAATCQNVLDKDRPPRWFLPGLGSVSLFRAEYSR
jgi:hypothetical protein